MYVNYTRQSISNPDVFLGHPLNEVTSRRDEAKPSHQRSDIRYPLTSDRVRKHDSIKLYETELQI